VSGDFKIFSLDGQHLRGAKVQINAALGAEELPELLHNFGASGGNSVGAHVSIGGGKMRAQLGNVGSEFGLRHVALKLGGDEAGGGGAQLALKLALDAVGGQIKVLRGRAKLGDLGANKGGVQELGLEGGDGLGHVRRHQVVALSGDACGKAGAHVVVDKGLGGVGHLGVVLKIILDLADEPFAAVALEIARSGGGCRQRCTEDN